MKDLVWLSVHSVGFTFGLARAWTYSHRGDYVWATFFAVCCGLILVAMHDRVGRVFDRLEQMVEDLGDDDGPRGQE